MGPDIRRMKMKEKTGKIEEIDYEIMQYKRLKEGDWVNGEDWWEKIWSQEHALSFTIFSIMCNYKNTSIYFYVYFPKRSRKRIKIHHIYQGCPTCGSRATCGSLKYYLWLTINVPEFPFNFCVIIYLKIIIVLCVFQNVF